MKNGVLASLRAAFAGLLAATCLACVAGAQEGTKPNILVIFGDDVGWMNSLPSAETSWA